MIASAASHAASKCPQYGADCSDITCWHSEPAAFFHVTSEHVAAFKEGRGPTRAVQVLLMQEVQAQSPAEAAQTQILLVVQQLPQAY